MRTKDVLLMIIAPLGLAFVVLGAVVVTAWATLGGSLRDLEAVDDADLALSIEPISASSNAYLILETLKKPVIPKNFPMESFLDGTSWDAGAIGKVLETNAEVMDRFAVALDKPDYQYPAAFAEHPDEAKLAPLVDWRTAGSLFGLKALTLQKQGKDKEALEAAFIPLELGSKIQASGATLIEYLIATAMKSQAYRTIQVVASGSTSISSEEYKGYIRRLTPAQRNEEGLITGIKFEYQAMSKTLDDMKAGRPGVTQELFGEMGPSGPDKYSFQMNRTKEMFARFHRMGIEAVGRPCADVSKNPERIQGRLRREAGVESQLGYFQPNSIGKMLVLIGVPNYEPTAFRKCDDRMMAAMTQTFLAVKAFKIETGRYPLTLKELVPKYLGSVPGDPYGEGPIGYDAQKKRIYSVGRDGDDDESSVQLRF